MRGASERVVVDSGESNDSGESSDSEESNDSGDSNDSGESNDSREPNDSEDLKDSKESTRTIRTQTKTRMIISSMRSLVAQRSLPSPPSVPLPPSSSLSRSRCWSRAECLASSWTNCTRSSSRSPFCLRAAGTCGRQRWSVWCSCGERESLVRIFRWNFDSQSRGLSIDQNQSMKIESLNLRGLEGLDEFKL